jgi:hypothetical protein
MSKAVSIQLANCQVSPPSSTSIRNQFGYLRQFTRVDLPMGRPSRAEILMGQKQMVLTVAIRLANLANLANSADLVARSALAHAKAA